jgi:hypothetical protein
MDAEVRAVSVERCLRQAIMPRAIDSESDALMWRNDRPAWDARLGKEPALAIWSETFKRQSTLVGRSFVATREDADLERLFGQCAMYIRRTSAIDAAALPDPKERQAGKLALRQIRNKIATIYFRDRVYSE